MSMSVIMMPKTLADEHCHKGIEGSSEDDDSEEDEVAVSEDEEVPPPKKHKHNKEAMIL